MDERSARLPLRHDSLMAALVSAVDSAPGHRLASTAGELLLRQPVCNELRDAAGCRGVEVREHGHNVAGRWADLEFAIHPWRASAMTKTADAVGRVIVETEGITAAPRGIDLARRQHFRITLLDQLVCFQRICKFQQICHGGVTPARRSAAV